MGHAGDALGTLPDFEPTTTGHRPSGFDSRPVGLRILSKDYRRQLLVLKDMDFVLGHGIRASPYFRPEVDQRAYKGFSCGLHSQLMRHNCVGDDHLLSPTARTEYQYYQRLNFSHSSS